MTSRQELRDTSNSIQVTGSEASTNNAIVSLTLHRQAIHWESKWTAPEWGRCCTQQVSKAKDMPCDPLNISQSFENPTHYIPMSVHKIFYAPKTCYLTALQFSSYSLLELPHKLSVHHENIEILEIFSMFQFYTKLLRNILTFPRLSDFSISEWTMEIIVTWQISSWLLQYSWIYGREHRVTSSPTLKSTPEATTGHTPVAHYTTQKGAMYI